MEEAIIHERINDIIAEYSQLKELENCDVEFLSLNDKGDIKVTIIGRDTGIGNVSDSRREIAERTIRFTEPLDFISDTIFYPGVFGTHSKDIALEALRIAYFDIYGYLILEHTDGSMEKFTVKEKNVDAVKEILKVKLGKKFKA
jgi:hypothetical protein